MIYNVKNLRKGQREAIEALFKKYEILNERPFLMELPTRYGKTTVIRLIAAEAMSRGITRHFFCLNTATVLRDNVAGLSENKTINGRLVRKKGKWVTDFERFDVNSLLKSSIIKAAPDINARFGDATFYSVNIQVMIHQKKDFDTFVDSLCCYNKPPMVFVDECQFYGEGNDWGSVIAMFRRHHCPIIMLSGTPFRADKKEIFGIKARVIREEERTQNKFRESGRTDTVIKDTFFQILNEQYIESDYRYSFKEAYNEGAICALARHAYDVELTRFGITEVKLLSEASESVTRKVLHDVLRDEEVINRMVDGFVTDIERMRAHPITKSKLQGIVFVGSKMMTDAVDTQQLAKVNAAIKKARPSWSVAIATSHEDESSNADSVQTIKDFCDGNFDVLIVKEMGGVGIDAPFCKVALDLSPTRTLASIVQRWTRAATIGEWKIYRLLTVHDCFSRAAEVWMRGEEQATYNKIEFEELIRSEEIPVGPTPPDATKWQVHGILNPCFFDSYGNEADASYYAMIEKLKSIDSGLMGLTEPQLRKIIDVVQSNDSPSSEEPRFKDLLVEQRFEEMTDKELLDVRKEYSGKITNQLYGYSSNQDEAQARFRQVNGDIRKRAGVRSRAEIKKLGREDIIGCAKEAYRWYLEITGVANAS
jgi:superfamily II DNA or RNA helicase